MASINLENVTKTYAGGVKAVKGVDVAIGDGEFVVLVGPSGCGKSTMLRMIAGLETITEGTIRIADKVVNRMEPAVLGEILDRDQFRAVDHADQLNAAVDRLIHQLAFDKPADGNCTGAAIALTAAFLRPFLSGTQPKIVEQRLRRLYVAEFDDFAAFQEPDGVAHGPQLPR